MRSFKEYDGGNARDGSNTWNNGGEQSAAEDLTRRIAEAFDGKSSATMLKSILEEAEKNKREGKLSNEEIDAFYEQFAPMLNGTQRAFLKNVVEKLKDI